MPRQRTDRERVLAALAPPGDAMSIEQIAGRSGVKRANVAVALGKLRSQGLAESTERGHYRLTRAGVEKRACGDASKPGPKGPHTGRRKAGADSLRSRIWHALRASGKATLPDLLVSASRGSERAAKSNASSYLCALERAGYVTRLARRRPGTKPTSCGHVQYLLMPDRDTGMQAPVHRARRQQLFDPNTGETFNV